MSMLDARKSINFIIYFLLFASSVFVNKYVLSVLKFIYPTIYQGWQTLVGGILLKCLITRKHFSTSSIFLDKAGFISLLPSFLFFAAGIVASSKALAGLSVAIYLCLQNTLNATLYLLEIAPSFRGGSGLWALLASFSTLASAFAAVVFDINMTFSDSPYFWMMVYLSCLAVQSLHSKIADARYSEIDRLYFSYIFSVVVLAPASLYLEEAFEVLKFPNASRYDFYAGCLLSGVVGLFLNIITIKVRHQPLFSSVDAGGRLAMSCLAVITFTDKNSSFVKCLIFVNLISAIFVPIPKPIEIEDGPKGTEGNLPLLAEELDE